jgi:hypothetical protein
VAAAPLRPKAELAHDDFAFGLHLLVCDFSHFVSPLFAHQFRGGRFACLISAARRVRQTRRVARFGC